MEAAFEKAFADPEMQALRAKWQAVVESYQLEFYAPVPWQQA
jgi:hypothetical protein